MSCHKTDCKYNDEYYDTCCECFISEEYCTPSFYEENKQDVKCMNQLCYSHTVYHEDRSSDGSNCTEWADITLCNCYRDKPIKEVK